jgi:ABC-type transport system involved in multi-copper enzyme maturation permease subunit
MNHLIRAELLKLRTTRMFWANALAALVFVPLSVATSILGAGDPGPALTTSEGLRNVISAGSAGSLVILVLGVLVMAGEFRHNTATSTFLVSPRRSHVVLAKLIAASVVGLVLALAASVLTLAVALPWLASKGIDVDVLSGDIAGVLLGGIAATILFALVGVGVGSMVRNQTAAVAGAVAWVIVVEGLLVSFTPDVGRWLPGGASSALSGVAVANGGLLPMWGAALLLTLYGLAFAAAGIRFVLRRDVT